MNDPLNMAQREAHSKHAMDAVRWLVGFDGVTPPPPKLLNEINADQRLIVPLGGMLRWMAGCWERQQQHKHACAESRRREQAELRAKAQREADGVEVRELLREIHSLEHQLAVRRAARRAQCSEAVGVRKLESANRRWLRLLDACALLDL